MHNAGMDGPLVLIASCTDLLQVKSDYSVLHTYMYAYGNFHFKKPQNLAEQ